MWCNSCLTRDSCSQICKKVEDHLYNKHGRCSYDAGVFCSVGDPHGLYHPSCSDTLCSEYRTSAVVKPEVEINVQFRELSFGDDSLLERIALSEFSSGEIVDSDGYAKFQPIDININASPFGEMFRKYVQSLLINNPSFLTPYQLRATRLYYSLISRREHSLTSVAKLMGVSKMRIVHHLSVSMSKIKRHIMYLIVEESLNGSYERFEQLGIEIGNTGKQFKMNKNDLARTKTIITSEIANEILSRQQLNALFLFCGVDGDRRSLEEIAKIMEISRESVYSCLHRGINNINKVIIAKILDNQFEKMCAARDCENTFISFDTNKKYCSVDCKYRERERRYRDKKKFKAPPKRLRYKSKICEMCGKVFLPVNKKQRFHDEKCRRRYFARERRKRLAAERKTKRAASNTR